MDTTAGFASVNNTLENVDLVPLMGQHFSCMNNVEESLSKATR